MGGAIIIVVPITPVPYSFSAVRRPIAVPSVPHVQARRLLESWTLGSLIAELFLTKFFHLAASSSLRFLCGVFFL